MSQWSKVSNIKGPPGTDSSSGGNWVNGELPVGLINGVNPIFTTANPFIAGSLCVYLNGLRQDAGDYSETSNQTFQFIIPPWVGSKIRIDYMTP